jgi:hypothetical protein
VYGQDSPRDSMHAHASRLVANRRGAAWARESEGMSSHLAPNSAHGRHSAILLINLCRLCRLCRRANLALGAFGATACLRLLHTQPHTRLDT